MNAWLLASRPKTLAAAVVPVLVGAAGALASPNFRLAPALAALAGALLIQIGTNFANDVFDYEKGADTSERLGPVRVVQAGLLSARAVRRGMIAAFALAALAGVYLVSVAGPVIIVIGLASVASGIAYTAGPYPLAYLGLGDLFVLAFFGFVAVCGTALVAAGRVSALAWWSAVPVGALATAILVVNNLRDHELDLKANKRTLAVRFGPRAVIAEYVGLLAVSYAVPIILAASRLATPWVLLPLVTAPLALALIAKVRRASGRDLNPALDATARLLLLFGLLFAAGLARGAR